MSEEKPKEKKKYVKPEILPKGNLEDRFSTSGFDIGLWGENVLKLKLKEDIDIEEKEAYISRELGAILVDYATSKFYETNDTATFIINLIQNKKTLEEIMKSICEQYEVDQEVARTDLISFLAELKKYELLEE